MGRGKTVHYYNMPKAVLAKELIRVSDRFFGASAEELPPYCVNPGTFERLCGDGWPLKAESLIPPDYRRLGTSTQAWAILCEDLTGRTVATPGLHQRMWRRVRDESDRVLNAALSGDDRYLNENMQALLTGEVLPMIPRWRTVRAWNLHTHSYVPIGHQLVYEMR